MNTAKASTPRPEEVNASRQTREQQALLEALTKLLLPLARLGVGSGIMVQSVEEALRRAYVYAAVQAHAGSTGASGRLTSRISATTGLTRREVTRLQQDSRLPVHHKPSAASEVFTRWVTDPKLRDIHGLPRALPRQDQQGGFDALAQSVTRDVHPRAILEELLRLELVRVDENNGLIALHQMAFVPRSDRERMAQYLGDNLGDHLQAAADNLLGDGRQHMEQAVMADELSHESVEQVKDVISHVWQEMLAKLTDEFTHLIEQDRIQGRKQDMRIRVGLYSFHQPMPDVAPADAQE
jgi:Family of unknown function (DUF6502)